MVAQPDPATPSAGDAQVAVDEDPVANGVDQVGADEGEHHRLDEPHALQVTAEGRIDEQRHRAPGQRLEECRGLAQNVRMHAELAQRGITGKEQEHDQRAEDQAEVQPLNQPAVALLAPAGSEGLRHQGVQAQEQPHAEDRHGEEERVAQADRADGHGAPSRPTKTVSTTPMAIQPSSARTTGPASLSMGRSSVCNPCLNQRMESYPGTGQTNWRFPLASTP